MMGFGRALGFAAVLLAAQGCANTMALVTPPPSDPHTQMAALELRIFELVEDERHKIDPHAKTLVLDSELVGVARQRSADMAAKNYFAHKGPDGQTSAGLIMDEDAKFQGLLGENLAAQHFNVGYGIDVEVFAHRFVASWLASPSHKDNLAFAAYDRSGVGAAVSGNTIYVTQLFATDLGLSSVPTDPKSRRITELPDTKSAKKSAGGQPPPPATPGLLPDE
ncbi:MAG: CAP domain-containing protein [Rhizomicrobium sp.]